jgi:plastocyanin
MQKILSIMAIFLVAGLAVLAAPKGYAVESYEIHIKDHQFVPAKITIPAGVKVHLWVYNDDDTPEEFESLDFHREKIIVGHGKVKISVGPLKAGTYQFFGDFHAESAKGTLIVE